MVVASRLIVGQWRSFKSLANAREETIASDFSVEKVPEHCVTDGAE
jgi:hypothetical protein